MVDSTTGDVLRKEGVRIPGGVGELKSSDRVCRSCGEIGR
jgi:hypothetical protein